MAGPDDFLLTGDAASNPLAGQLVAYADQLETTAMQALQLLGHDVPLVGLRPEEIQLLRQAVATAHGAGRDLRLIATALQRRVDGAAEEPPSPAGSG